MFRKYLYDKLENPSLKESVVTRKLEEWYEKKAPICEGCFKAGFFAAIGWVEEIIMKHTTEEYERLRRR